MMSEVEKLRMENKRLKRTLLERFDETFSWFEHQGIFIFN
jgi:hypothetical protein